LVRLAYIVSLECEKIANSLTYFAIVMTTIVICLLYSRP